MTINKINGTENIYGAAPSGGITSNDTSETKLGSFGYGCPAAIDSTQLQQCDKYAASPIIHQFDGIDPAAYINIAQKGATPLDGNDIDTKDPAYLSDISYWENYRENPANSELCEV